MGNMRRVTILTIAVALTLAAGCVTEPNDLLSIDAYTPPAVAANITPPPSVDAPSVVSPYRDNWATTQVVVPTARLWTHKSNRFGDWPAKGITDRTAFPLPPVAALDPGDGFVLPFIPMVLETAQSAMEMAVFLPHLLVYTIYFPTQEPLEPYQRAPVWDRPASSDSHSAANSGTR